MKRTTLHVTASLATAVFLAGCQGEEADDMDLGGDPSATPQMEEPTTPRDGSGAADATLQVSQYEGQPYVTDGEGRALYLLEGATDPGACTDACAQAWPPFVASAENVSATASELNQDMVGTVSRPDGTMQVTYNGHPLYHYAQDTGPGQTAGQDVHDEWGGWYLVTPDGNPLETHEEGGQGGS